MDRQVHPDLQHEDHHHHHDAHPPTDRHVQAFGIGLGNGGGLCGGHVIEGSVRRVPELSVLTTVTSADVLPRYAHSDDAGADLRIGETVTLRPGERALVRTGVALALPSGYVGLVHPRSGLAHRHGVTLVNAPGVIDAGYRGEIMLNLINLDPDDAVTLNRGDRAAQLLVQRVERVRFDVVDVLDATDRADRGHGSTGR